jgi:Sec-independent protein translocase protein TatA
MEILGIGPLEIILILVLALIIFGPKEIDNAGKTIGKNLNKLIRSDTWKTINQTSQELKNLPTRLMRESGLDELEKSTNEELSKAENMIKQSVSMITRVGALTGSDEYPPDSTEVKRTDSPEEDMTEK